MTKLMRLGVLVLSIIVLAGCSSDDGDSSGPSLSDAPIVGTWNLKYHKAFGITINNTTCHQQSYIVWNADFSGDRKTYANNGQGGPCFLTGEGTGTWQVIPESESVSGENYEFTDEGGVHIEEKIVFIDADNMYIDYNTIEFHYERAN